MQTYGAIILTSVMEEIIRARAETSCHDWSKYDFLCILFNIHKDGSGLVMQYVAFIKKS